MNEEILEILKNNVWAGGIFALVIGLYVAGEIEERSQGRAVASEINPTEGMTVDEEIAFHETRLKVLKLLKEENLSMEDLVLQMQNTIEELQTQLETQNA